MSRKSKSGKQFQSFKWILLVCSAMIFMSCSNTDERKDFGLNGNVKSYFEKLYKVEKKFGKWENGAIEYYGHSQVTFDKKGQYQETEYYDDNMDLAGKGLPVRENGKILEEIDYDKDGELLSKTIIKHITKNEGGFELFDSTGKKIAYGKNIRKNGKLMKQIYTTIQDSGEDETYTTLLEYDKNGNVISQKHTNKKGEIDSYLRFEYLEFDAKNNWTKKLIYEDDNNPKNITIREIEYY